MSSDASITIKWPDAEHTYRLRLLEIRELQEARDAGVFAIARRVGSLEARIEDVHETLRLGLIGGGMSPLRAQHVVDKYANVGNLQVAALVASVVLQAAINGDKHDELKKKLEAYLQATAEQEQPDQTIQTASTSPVYMAVVP